MEDKLLGLYNDFKNAGLFKDTKDYGTFRQRMQGQGYQAQIYKVAKQNGADVGQFWQFQRNFGLGRWAGGSRQPVNPTKPLTTAQRAGQVAQEYKKKLQQKSGAYKEGANFVQANRYEGESLGDLIGDAWEGVKSVGRKIGNSVSSHMGDYGGSVRTAARQVNPNYGAKPSKETHQVLKSWDVLTKKDSQLTPAERAVASNMRTRMQRAQEQAARQEQQRATPISRSRITPTAKNFNETMQQLSTPEAKQARIKQQHEDDINQMAYQGVGQNLGKDIFAMTDKAIDLAEQSSKDFFKGAEDALGFSRQYDPRIQKSIADAADMRKSTEVIQQGLQVGLADKVQEYFSRPEIQKNVMDTAEKMNISLEEAVQKYYMPNLMQYAKDAVEQRQLEKVLPQGFFDYLGKNLSNTVIGMIASNALYSKEERQRRQRALAISEGMEEAPRMVGHNTDYYKAGVLSRAAGTGVNMLADSPIFGAGGTAADMAVNTGSRILARGLEKVGLKAIGKVLTPREMAFKAANMSMAQKMMSGLTTGTAKSALNLGGYSSITGGLQQISTGEDSSPAAVAMAAITSGWHGAKTGAMFGFSGGVMHPWASRYGITGLERNAEQRFIHGAQKVGATAASVGVEAGTMMVADHLQDDKEMSFAQWLEDGVTVMAFKLGEPRNYKHVGSILHGLTHNTSKTPITLTKDEKNELINSVSGKNLMDAFLDVSKASRKAPMYKSVYKDFMADPEVSRSTKEKVNAALGMPSQNYKIPQRSVNDVKNKQILEYASDGTLLTRTSYKNAEERRDILYRQKADRDNMYVWNLVGIAKLRGRQLVDDSGKVSRVAADFLQDKGYDISKDPTDPKNAELIANLQNPNHELYLDWIKYADERNQFTGVDASINKILEKQPLKRTDEEVAKLKEYAKSLETQLFPDNKLHTEESRNQGRRAAEDNNLGTEQPNGEAVKQGLDGLRQAENNFEAAYESNDVLKIGLNKLAEDMGTKPKTDGLVDVLNALQEKGFTNPQIYGILADPSGKYIVSEEQLTPFAQYMHANERVQGMQEATKEAIDENVNTRADQWSFHGTMNGNEMNGEQVLYVKDSEGRTLIVGSGEVAFDSTTGKAKEDVGDMLVCLDANTRETVWLKADEVTFIGNQSVEDFKNAERLRLQNINSQPYNEAAQEQAMQDAAKPQQEQEAPQDNTTKSEDSTTKEGDLTKDDTTLTKVNTTSGKDNTTNEDLVPQEQPQQGGEGMRLEDGTPVPFDANGEPDFLKMTPEHGAEVYKMLFEEDAPMQIDSDIKTLEKDLEKVKASKYEGASVMERAAARKKVKEAIALAEAQVERAKAIKAAMEKKPEAENTGVGTVGNAGQYEKERQQGYREGEGGVIYRRQKPEDVGGVRGKEVNVAFSPTEKVAGHVKLVELDTVQASHNNGQLNLLHFGPDWQPKDRSSQASRVEAEKIAGNIDPEQITGSDNAFIGSAPIVNERHETIQGNNRVDALKAMYANHPDQAAKYKHWLIDHAAEFGLNAEDIKKMNKPVIVNELPVDDATAKKLGQMMASGFESGGKRIPEVSATINKLGDKMENLANVLLAEGTLGEDAKLSDLINQNSKRALEFLNRNGFIDNTEYENLATDIVTRRQWLENVLKASLFDGNRKTEAAFNTLPGNAQKAVLATFMRDRNSKAEDKIKQNIQKSFEAYNELNHIAGFKNAKNIEQARAAIQAELLNGSNNVFGEASIREKYTNFELELAALYKGLKDQKSLTGLFGEFYDAVQGKVGKELDAFSQVNAEPLSKDEAIEKVFGINNKQENDRRRETESPSESGGEDGAEPAGDRPAGEESEPAVKKNAEPSADPMEGIKQAADAFHEEQKQKGEFAMNLKIGKARQDYAAAKESGDAERTTKAAKELKHLLDDKLKQEGKGLAERQKIIAEEIGKAEAEIIDKPWEQMDLEEREAVSSKNPLTESEINELTSEENKELIPAALAYLRGDKGNIINAISYFKIWNDVRNRHENVSDNSGTENGTQLDAADTTGGEGLGLGRGRESGRPDGPVDRGAGNETAPGERNGGESNQNDTTLSAGEQGDKQGEGNSSGMGAVPAGSSDTNGGSSAGGNGHVSGGSGRESSNRPADTNAGRKPTAKQGTIFPDSTAERLKQERADYEKKKKDFWNRWKKAGQGYAKIALTPFKKLNLTPEQIEMLPELFKMHLNGAVLKIKEGIYKFNEWKAAMLAEEGEELKMIGLSDDDIDRFIEDYWNTPYEMDGETHTIREWSSIYGNQQLKKKLKEPLEEKYKRQMEAEPIEVKVGDMKNIEETLPYLLPQQQEDVLKAETQFFGKEHTDREHAYGKGYLFTNGTGTGKTYTGLGIAKRLAKQGKGRILFITPSQKKVSDWIKDGKNLGLDIKDLDSWAKMRGTTATTESGEGMVITTFANFGLNKKLLETEWDAVIYDECHRIMENKKGTETARSMQHYMVTNRDENHCFQRLQSINPEYQKMNGAAEKFNALRLKEIERIKKEYKNSHPSATDRDVDNATLKSLPRDLNSFASADGMTFPKLGKAYQDFIKARDTYNKVEPKLKEQAKSSWKHTKTIFLSATPFNTRENLDYVEGYIFKYPEKDERGMGGRTQFYLNHFGAAYKFRYHRLEQSISNPDAVAKQEVAFSDYLQNTLGTMSGRIIDSPYDYSRDFPTVAPDHADDFNHAVQDTLKTKYLHDAYSKTIGDYNYGSALFETMKVSAAIDRVKQHLDLGRKVVIFHRRVESKEPLEAPFAYMLRVANEQIKMMKPGKERDEYIKECTEFRNKYADLLEWEKTLDYSMPREQIAKVFGEKNVLFFSGKESKKVKDKAVDTFNDDDSGKNIIVIQEASGKEGISLHDTTSKHQRVCITLALPQSPITALQIEGRIYRIGNMSNAIFEYPILGLNSEMMLFGEKFNNQVSTTENLALGSQARNLRDSFANGILEHSGIVPVENQGVGGKEFDAATPSENDPFDNAVLDYYSNQKLNKNNREGSDYFPTPEPLGYKMVEWAGLGEGDSVLEPSAGHGAIARYVPKTNEMVGIEPSQSLFTKLQLKAGGLGRKFLNNTFENYALNNKHDVIVMNPPFGKAGALAIQHVDKAFKHLDEGGRIVAIIPRGSTDKKFDKWYNEQKNVAMRAEVNLPDILFQHAGTRVVCRVVVLDKISDAALRSKAGYPEKIDLSGHYDKIEDFFNDLRDIEMPERIIDTNLKMQKKAKAAVKDIMEIKGVKNVSYGKTGINVSLTGSWMNYGISFTGSDKPNYWRDKMANYYTKYDELQKLEYQENKQSVFDELKKLSCKLAGMTEDEMQRYIASKTNGSTHFREDRGLQYSKTDTKDVKNSRIIPEDVDKNVSSQIEKSYDAEVNRLFGHYLSPNQKRFVDETANDYASRSLHDEYYVDEETKEKKTVMGLDSAYKFWNNKVTEFEQKYGINRNTDISRLEEESRKAFANSFGEGRNSGRSAEQTNRYQGKDGYAKGGTGSGRDKASLPTPEEIFGYQCNVLERESVLRAYSYHKERARILSEKYGIDSGGWIQPETIEKIFNDFNTDKNLKVLFDRIKDQVNNLGIYFGEVYGEEKGTDGFYRHDSFNDIRLNIDGLLTAARTRQDFASVILHEMLHPLTSDIIAMYQKGHAEKLTKSQAEAAKNVVDIYNRLKSLYKEKGWKEPYALTNPREMMTELANPSWREALQGFEEGRSIWRKVLDSIRKFFGFAPTRHGLSDLNKALDNVLNNFGKEQFDFATRHSRELFGKEPQGHKVTDPEEIKRLEEEPKIKVYRAMQVIDGKLYPPMAAYADGKLVEANELGKWIQADEMPDSKNTVYKYKGTTTTIPKDRAVKGEDGIWRDSKNGAELAVGEDGNPTWYFKLQKGKGATGKKLTDVPAAYNPYWHTSYSPLNDQFKSAWIRPNVVVVECEVPAGELTSGYRAEHAKDPVGMTPWTSGVVTKQLVAKGHEGRKVMLSRWCKPVKIVPDEEVAAKIKDFIGDYDVEIPENVVTPRQKVELEKLGVKIGAPEKGMNKNEQIAEAIKLGLQVDNTVLSEDGTKFRTDHGDGNYPASSVESHVEKVAQKTGGKVQMVSSVDEITNKAARAAIEDGRKITGWYDEKTGEVHLYMPNIHDRYTAEKTIWHEVVGHKGMRELFGEDRFEKFLRDVWYDLDKPENAALKKLVDEERKYNPLNIYDAIEEGIARLAEDGKGEPGFWNGIKNKVSDFLHEIGYRIAPNTKDVKYLLWLSKNLQKNQNDPYWKMRAEAVKYRLDHDRMPAVVAHDGMFYGNDGKVRSMDNLTKAEWNEATDGEIHFRTTPSAATALDRYHRSLDEHGYMFTESYMDNMLSLKKLMNAIVPDKKIEDIASSENPYILQNTMQGAMSDAAQMFERNVMKPLDKAMADVLDAFDGKKDDEKIRNFNLYMITKHGLERNRVFFVRDFLKKMRRDEKKKQDADFLEKSYYSDKEYLDNELKAGNIDLKEYYRQLDESIRNHFDADFEAGEHDYSGIHAIQEVAKSSDPYDDAEAIQSVMDSEAKMEGIRKGAVKDYWGKVKAATQYSIDSDYKNGIISSELYGHVSNMFNWYVPLRKYDEATAEDVYGYITEVGDPKSYIGSTIMRARGHKYLSETNVLAQIGAMGNRAIKNGGMNAIRQAFARFARNNSNNNLITETSVWYEKDPMTGIVYERYPDIPEDATADEINQIVYDFNKDMKAKALQNLASKVYRRGSIGYKFQRAENKSQHIVDVKIAGRTHAFIINGNPRAAQALNGLLENSGAKGIMKPLSSISRMMAQLCTSYNPEFVMRNIMRDAEFASSNVTSKEGARYGALWAKYYAQLCLYKGASNISLKDFSGSTGLGLFAKYRNGTLDMSNKVERYFKEFMENGGETGWVQIKNMKDWTKEYKKDVSTERSKLGKGGAALRDFFFGNLENVNEVAENIARFATYCTSRDSNRSIIRSVYDAKEVSTNFNRHGSGDAISSFKNGEMTGAKAAERWVYGFTASYLRHCSMFFNAGIQSTNLLVKNLKNHPVGTSINMLAIPFALGALAALGNNVLIASEDEEDRKGVKDPYGELPDYVRRNNLCIYKGKGEFVTIPLAIELRAFYGLGDLAAGLTFSPNVSGQKNPALDAVGCMSQLVPVMDYLGNSSADKEPLNETIKAISPSALSPFVEWELNTDWKGAPIERRGDWNENSPAWQRAYKGVPDGYMAVNKFVNAQTNEVANGNEDMLGNSFLDMVTNPSMLNHYIGGLGGGAATFTERAIGVVKHGKDTETKDIPFLRSLLYTPSEQSSLQRTKSKWYNYKDEMEKMIANVDRLKSKNVPIEKRISNYSDYYRFQNSKDAAKVRVIELAEKQMKQWKKLRDKSSDTESINFANQNIDRIMMEAVDDLDKLN